jgi:hypothetical protein
MPGDSLVLVRGLLRAHDTHQFHLVELVYPDQTTSILAVGECLTPKARCAGDIGPGQLAVFQNFVAMDVGYRHLCRWNQEEIIGRRGVHLLGKLGQLAGPGKSGAVDQVRRSHLHIAMLPSMQIQHEVGECTDQSCSRTSI